MKRSHAAADCGPCASYLIHADRVIDGTGSAPIEEASIWVREGRIAYVGPRAEVPQTGEIRVIDGRGLSVMPGLIDGHNGFVGYVGMLGSVEVLRHYLQFGITTAISFHGNPEGNQPWGVPLRDAIDQGKLRGCARVVVGYVVNCTNAHNHGRTADGPWEVRRAVREMAQAGADFVKTAASGGFWGKHEGLRLPNYTREEFDALVDEAHAWGMRVGVHAHSQPGLDRAIEAGADLIYHGCLMDRAALEKMAGRGTWFLPTLRITSERNLDAWPGMPWQRERMGPAARPHREGFRLARELGVPLAMGSDGPGSSHVWKYGESSTFEVAEMVRCGMEPLEAIRTATLNTATAYGIGDRVGSIEPGKEADLLCVEGNPLDDMERMQDQKHVAIVLQQGRVEYAAGAYQCLYEPKDTFSCKG
ncbi:MAG TPA: amidohydrolase family protein [Chthoniobacteraceae bacterium]|nr:amidohydrolase family protein [Chthoniobacteraceae bacterium]